MRESLLELLRRLKPRGGSFDLAISHRGSDGKINNV